MERGREGGRAASVLRRLYRMGHSIEKESDAVGIGGFVAVTGCGGFDSIVAG